MKNVLLKFPALNNIMVCYVFVALLIKNIILVSFMLDPTYVKMDISLGFNYVFCSDTYRVFYFCGFSLIIVAPISLLKNKSKIVLSIMLNIIISIIFLVFLWYLRGFGSLPSLYTLQTSGNVGDALASELAVIKSTDVIFLLDIPILIIISIVGIRNKLFINKSRQPIFSAVLFSVALILLLIIAPVVNKSTKNFSNDWVFNKIDSVRAAYNISPTGYMIFSTYSFFKNDKHIALSANDKKKINSWYDKQNESLTHNSYSGMFKGKNLILIQVESLENFVINQKIDGQEVTPTLNKLLNNSLYFSDFHEQVNQGNSSDADLLANTSMYPIRVGSTFFISPTSKYNSIPVLLKPYGYYTSAFHPDSGAYWNWMPALKSMGFDKCIDSAYYKIDERIIMGISDGSYLKQIEPMLKQQKMPFYSFIVTLSSHSPFDIPKKYRDLKLSSELDKSNLGGYFQSIHYTDKQLGMFLEKLDNDKMLDDTVIAIYGDHEGVHKYFPDNILSLHSSEKWWLHNDGKVPFIIYKKNFTGASEIKTTGGQVDILPTLLYLMGVDEQKYMKTAMGRNLLKTNKSFAVLKNGTVLGTLSQQDKEHAIEGLKISDMIIRGNYFK